LNILNCRAESVSGPLALPLAIAATFSLPAQKPSPAPKISVNNRIMQKIRFKITPENTHKKAKKAHFQAPHPQSLHYTYKLLIRQLIHQK
jgi:hypothetical protein